MSRSDAMLRILWELKTRGGTLAMNKFGTGPTSLDYFTLFPDTPLKVDRSFVRNVSRENDDSAIIAAILAMANGLRRRGDRAGTKVKGA